VLGELTVSFDLETLALVEFIATARHTVWGAVTPGTLEISAPVTMMCVCPVTPPPSRP